MSELLTSKTHSSHQLYCYFHPRPPVSYDLVYDYIHKYFPQELEGIYLISLNAKIAPVSYIFRKTVYHTNFIR